MSDLFLKQLKPTERAAAKCASIKNRSYYTNFIAAAWYTNSDGQGAPTGYELCGAGGLECGLGCLTERIIGQGTFDNQKLPNSAEVCCADSYLDNGIYLGYIGDCYRKNPCQKCKASTEGLDPCSGKPYDTCEDGCKKNDQPLFRGRQRDRKVDLRYFDLGIARGQGVLSGYHSNQTSSITNVAAAGGCSTSKGTIAPVLGTSRISVRYVFFSQRKNVIQYRFVYAGQKKCGNYRSVPKEIISRIKSGDKDVCISTKKTNTDPYVATMRVNNTTVNLRESQVESSSSVNLERTCLRKIRPPHPSCVYVPIYTVSGYVEEIESYDSGVWETSATVTANIGSRYSYLQFNIGSIGQ